MISIKTGAASWITLLLILSTSCSEKSNQVDFESSVENVNREWFYLENPEKDPNAIRSDEEWVAVDLPHTWNDEDVMDIEAGYRRSSSWYKKTFDIDGLSDDILVSLLFEGANMTSVVYVNGQKAGGHVGGYLSFEVEMTPYLKSGENEILVRVDNGYNPQLIPSQKSDFFLYGGITRDVWLVKKHKNHFKDVLVSTPNVTHETADVHVKATIPNLGEETAMSVEISLIDPSGNEVFKEIAKITSASFEYSKSTVENPELWHVDHPNLYTLRLKLLKENKVIDTHDQKFGFRWFEFKENGPFYLNGERLLLRGTHRHEEHAGVGAAMTNSQHRKDMEMIKEMGANFVRLAHYPQDPEIYKACDELGLLVWDELPWCRGGLGDEVWQANTTRMLGEMIVQNYNHPSIIMWSLGNEIYWLPDFEGGGDTDKINAYLTGLNVMAHQLDPYRPTAIRKYYEGSHIVDVFSPSIWSGWYSGSYKNYAKAIATYKKEYPRFIHTEYGGSSHVGRHTENPINGEGVIKSEGWEEAIVQTDVANIAQMGDWSENYIVDLFDWHLRVSEADSTFVGNAQWAFKDFGTPLRPENDIPYVNQKGLVDREGNPKDAFYVFKSHWSKEPFVYIESPTWNVRQGPEGKKRTLSVYSNCQEVELFLNAESLGTRKRDVTKFPASGLTWDLLFKEGKNELRAVGTMENAASVEKSLEVTYRYQKNGPARSLSLETEKLENGNFLITAIALDKDGLRCLNYEEKIYFQCMGGGHLVKNQGTPTGSSVIAMANGKASIEVIPDSSADTLEVTVLNQSFKGTYLKIPFTLTTSQ